MTVRPINEHDNLLFPESLEKLVSNAELLRLDIDNSYLTLDAGFDSEYNKHNIRFFGLIPVIKPNPRGIQDREKRYRLLDGFEPLEHIYKERIKNRAVFCLEMQIQKIGDTI